MFLKNDKAIGAGSGAVTIIGPGVRIEGNISFSGYLRVQGEVLGDIVCLDEHHGTTVIHGAGSVTGSIRSPNIIVGGRVQGPLHATTSVEVHNGASVVGDVRYKQLAIHDGGIIDGLVKSSAAPEKAWEDRRIARSESPDILEIDGPHAHERRASDHFWTRRKIAIGGVLLAILAIVFLWPRHTTKPEPSVFIPEPAIPAPEPVKVEPPAPSVPAPPVVAPEPPAARPPTPVTSVDPSPELRKADSGRVINVEGMDPEKPSDLFFVATKEPVVLFKKLRSEPGDGTRIELGSGTKRRFSISEDEVVRVAAGKDLEVFYQGRKLSWGALHSGSWLRFVPLPAKSATQ